MCVRANSGENSLGWGLGRSKVNEFCFVLILLAFSAFGGLLGRMLGSASTRDCSSQSYVLHELLADRSDVLRESSAEHHNLLLVGSSAENFLNIASHICKRKQA